MTAEAYARVGLAVADAFSSCGHTKYEVNLLRPVTYIRQKPSPACTAAFTIRSAIEQRLTQGSCVGRKILDRVRLLREQLAPTVPQCRGPDLAGGAPDTVVVF